MLTLPQLRTLPLTETPPPGETHQSRKQRQLLYQNATLALGLRNDRADHHAMERDMTLFKEIVLELRHTPPLGLALDLIALWRQGSQFYPRPTQPYERPYQRLLLQIQNEVFHRLMRSPSFQEMQRILQMLPTELEPRGEEQPDLILSHYPSRPQLRLSLQEKAIIYLVVQLFQPVTSWLVSSFRPLPIYPQSTSSMSSMPASAPSTSPEEPSAPLWLEDPAGCIEAFEDAIDQPGWITAHHQALIEQWLRLDSKKWLPPGCAPIVRHIKQLKSPLQRLQWQQLHDTLTQLSPASNLHELVLLRDLGYRELRIPTSSTKPEGGYSGLTRRGDIASLLPSELLFWDESQTHNPFFVRWVENETLYYEREQSHSHTRHRTLTFLLDWEPGEIRYKAPHVPAPGHILLFALLARICLDLRQVCPEEVLDFHFILGPESSWQEDFFLLSLFLSHLPHIGANTNFSLAQEPLAGLQDQAQRDNQLQMYIATATRWPDRAFSPTQFRMLISPTRTKLAANATVRLALEDIDPTLEELAQLRDHMLESILKTPLLANRESNQTPSAHRK